MNDLCASLSSKRINHSYSVMGSRTTDLGTLDKFEELVEKTLEKPFTSLLRGHMQPVEVAKRLARAMEAEQTLGVDKIFVPNEYHVLLNQRDFDHFASMRHSLERELADYIYGVARERRYTMLSKPAVTLEVGERVSKRGIQIRTQFSDYVPRAPQSLDEGLSQNTQVLSRRELARAARELAPQASLVVVAGPMHGTRLPIDKSTMTIGRALDNDIVIEDARISRYHAEIKVKAGCFCILDLHSSNGTKINRQLVTEAVLVDGDTLKLGDTEMVFQATVEDSW
jgi:hypothetical protein